jgi:hypothetical protein
MVFKEKLIDFRIYGKVYQNGKVRENFNRFSTFLKIIPFDFTSIILYNYLKVAANKKVE